MQRRELRRSRLVTTPKKELLLNASQLLQYQAPSVTLFIRLNFEDVLPEATA